MNFDKLKHWFHLYCIVYAAVLILLAINACRVSDTAIKRYESQQETLVLNLQKADSTTVAITKADLDSIKYKIENLVNRHIVFEDKYLSDLRQESNNNINKYNGWLSLWIALLTVLMGVVPFYFTLKVEKVRKEEFEEEQKRVDNLITDKFSAYSENLAKTKEEYEKKLAEKVSDAKRQMDELNKEGKSGLTDIRNKCTNDLQFVKSSVEARISRVQGDFKKTTDETIKNLIDFEDEYRKRMLEFKIQCTADCIHAAYNNQLLIDTTGRDKLWQSMLSMLKMSLTEYEGCIASKTKNKQSDVDGLKMIMIHVHSILNLWLPLLQHKHQSRDAALLLKDIAKWISTDCPTQSTTIESHIQNAKPLLVRVNSLIIKRS